MVAFPHRDELESGCTDALSPEDGSWSSLEGTDRECGAPARAGASSTPLTSVLPSLCERKVFSPANLRARLAVRIRLEHRLSTRISAELVPSAVEAADSNEQTLRQIFVFVDVGSNAPLQGHRWPAARHSGDY